MSVPIGRWKALVPCLLGTLVLLGVLRTGAAQVSLEYKPYHIDVYIALENPADLPAAAQQRLAVQLGDLSTAHVGAPWTLQAQFASGALAGELVSLGEEVTAERLLELTPDDPQRDKAFYVVMAKERSTWRVTIRELDFRTFRLSPATSEVRTSQSRLAAALLEKMTSIFTPLVMLDVAQRDVVTGTLQAAALITDPDSPAAITAGEPLLPVIRHNDRLGRATPQRVLAIPWTVLEVVSLEQQQVTCQIHSAHHGPLGRKGRLRLIRYAQLARYRAAPFELKLSSPQGDPLADYEILVRETDESAPRRLARTNEQGIAELPASSQPWQMLYVRHGDRVLARLPMVAGASRQHVAELPSDDDRLAAAGFIAAFRQEVIDTLARRQILITRVRRRMFSGEFDQAQELLDQLRSLETADDFSDRLNDARRTLRADNARAQQSIHEMFQETEQMLKRYLDPDEVESLAQQLAAAQREG